MITGSEWEIMRVIWTKGEVGSQDIMAILSQKFNWSESTVKTLIGRLVDKGIIQSRREGRRYLYWTDLSEKEASLNQVKAEFDKVCLTKQAALLADLLADLPMTQSDLQAFQAILDQKTPVAELTCDCIPGQCLCHEHHEPEEVETW